jgi:translation initiation factor 1
MCPDCGKPIAACVCRQAAAPVGGGTVRVRLDTKGRKGKGVTLITGVPLGAVELSALGKKLKQRCGAGGTVKDGVIEVQGDHCDLLVEELKQQGWNVKR